MTDYNHEHWVQFTGSKYDFRIDPKHPNRIQYRSVYSPKNHSWETWNDYVSAEIAQEYLDLILKAKADYPQYAVRKEELK